jgi:hypothetical protein
MGRKPLRNIAKRVSDPQRRSVESVTAEWYAVILMITVCHRTISFSASDLISHSITHCSYAASN